MRASADSTKQKFDLKESLIKSLSRSKTTNSRVKWNGLTFVLHVEHKTLNFTDADPAKKIFLSEVVLEHSKRVLTRQLLPRDI